MKKQILCIALLALCILAQVEDDEVVTETVEEVKVQQEQLQEDAASTQGLEGQAGGEAGEQNPYDNEEFREQVRDLYVSCIVTSRQKLSSYGDEFLDILKGLTDKEAKKQFYRKLLAQHIYTCTVYGSHHLDVPKQIIKSLQTNTFKISDWDVVFLELDFNKYKSPDFSVELNEEETSILQVVDQFDEVVKKNKGTEGEDDEIDEEGIPNMLRNQSPQPSIGGFQLSSLSSGTSFIYLIVIFSVLGGAIYYGYSNIDTSTPGPKTKEKKSKKKTQ